MAHSIDRGTDSHVTAHHEIAENDNIAGIISKDDRVDEVSMDVEDQSSTVDPLLETTLDYSLCSDLQDSKIADTCETQPAVKNRVASTTEPTIDVDENLTADTRTNSAVTDDLQKPVDLLAISNNVNVDLRNSPTVHSPPTLMVV